MENKTTITFEGIGFFGLLGIAFIILKLCGVIDWSWWFVLMPIYGPFALMIGLGVAVTAICLVGLILFGIGYGIYCLFGGM